MVGAGGKGMVLKTLSNQGFRNEKAAFWPRRLFVIGLEKQIKELNKIISLCTNLMSIPASGLAICSGGLFKRFDSFQYVIYVP